MLKLVLTVVTFFSCVWGEFLRDPTTSLSGSGNITNPDRICPLPNVVAPTLTYAPSCLISLGGSYATFCAANPTSCVCERDADQRFLLNRLMEKAGCTPDEQRAVCAISALSGQNALTTTFSRVAKALVCRCTQKISRIMAAVDLEFSSADATRIRSCTLIRQDVVAAAVSVSLRAWLNAMSTYCPKTVCCVATGRIQYQTSFVDARGNTVTTSVDSIWGAALPSVPEPLCRDILTQANASVAICAATQGVTITKTTRIVADCQTFIDSQYGGDPAKAFLASTTNFAVAWCNQSDPLVRCDDKYVTTREQLSGNSTIGVAVQGRTNTYEVSGNLTSGNSYEVTTRGYRLRVAFRNSQETVGNLFARNGGAIEVDGSSPNASARADYFGANGANSVADIRVARVIVNQRLDLSNGGTLSFSGNASRGDVEVNGLAVIHGGAAITRARLIMKQAAILKGTVTLAAGAKLECESRVLLDGAIVADDGSASANATGGYNIDCTRSLTATLVVGGGSQATIRTRTVTSNIEVDASGVIHIERDVQTKTIIHRDNATVVIATSRTLDVDIMEGGNGSATVSGTLVIRGSASGNQITMNSGAILRFTRSKNQAANGTTTTTTTTAPPNGTERAPETTTAEYPRFRLVAQTRLEVLRKALILSGDADFQGTIMVGFNTGDGFYARGNASVNGSVRQPPIVIGGSATASGSAIEVEVDAAFFARLQAGDTFVLIRWNNGNPMFPSTVTVRVVTSVSGRRRLQSTNTCTGSTGTGDYTISCGSGTTNNNGTGSNSTTSTSQGPTNQGPTNSSGAGQQYHLLAVLMMILIATCAIGFSSSV